MNTYLKNKYLLSLLFSLLTVLAFATDVKPPPPNPPPPGLLPIDGGIFILGIIAIAYGVAKKKW